ncbi:MAG TPA: multiheme c-type cytochrome [Usitatibacter sp.]|nr:multiheme c-type cytochrome [Usitatibacter sp.]
MRPLAAFASSLLALGLAPGAMAAEVSAPPLPYQVQAQHLGVVNCASSLCHGSISPWKDSNVLQNEYVTWSRVDKHSTRAYQVLLEERSQRIARNLGLAEPAHKAKLCLDCHAENPPPSLRGERFHTEEGIGCESCHGPAEHWIEAHVAAGATHAGNVKHGLYPTNEPVAQARLCLSCHFGNKDKFVTHRMMGAGHPRMSFELDTFAQTEPAHFVVDDDWRKRKGDWDAARVWAIGQAIAARELLDVLLDPKRSHDGLFPELVVFDCNACHHSMRDSRWSRALNTSPGRVRLNSANLLMLGQIARRVLPESDARDFEQRISALQRAVAGDGGDATQSARALRDAIDPLEARLAARPFASADLRAMVAGLVRDGANGQYRDYAAAEQATMAIGSLLNYLGKRGELGAMRDVNTALDAVYDTVKDDETYKPDRFRSALADLGARVNLPR